MYDYVIVTHIPAFYKVNLYNELAKKLNILVVFISLNTNERRANDFISLENANFKYKVLFDGDFQDRNIRNNIKKLRQILKETSYKKLLVSGWDLKEFWYLVLTNEKSKNCLALESTINESRVDGVRGFIKKIFLSRISTVFASGKLHVQLLTALDYNGNIKITKGVGIINKLDFVSSKREYKKRFLYIGRLSNEKNISLLINIFNILNEYRLTIIGTGPLFNDLKEKSKSNIIFEGQIDNKELKKYFFDNDIFILPSISEPWGLVVEESLYFGMPVIISQKCGSSELIEHDKNGYIFNEFEELKRIILDIDNAKYESFLNALTHFSIEKKDEQQIESYLIKN